MTRLLDAAEALALDACEAIAGNGEGAAGGGGAAFAAWLAGESAASPLVRLARGFGCGASETALIALLFAAALSEPVARRLAALSPGSGGRGVPLWLALRLIPGLEPDAVAPGAALRRFDVVGCEPGVLRIEAHLWLAEGLVDRLAGSAAALPELESRLARLPARPGAAADPALAAQLAAALAARDPSGLSPLVLAGRTDRAAIAAALGELGLGARLLRAPLIPLDAEARDLFARRWSREAALDAAVLLILADEASPAADALIGDLAERVAGHVVIAGPARLGGLGRSIRILDDPAPPPPAQRWRRALGEARAARLGAMVPRIAAQFRLEESEIDALCARMGPVLDAAVDGAAAGRALWHAAGRLAAPAPTPGVSVVEPAYGWEDIILAPAIESGLRRLESHVRHAALVMDDWGFAERMGGRGRGVAALFSGPSGTGKTMAAEVIAKALDLRMMLIDLSQIISKYVGETSKNIAAAFDQAERCGAVMVWNEGDSIWGSRGAVGNATDRHVNAEVGDLLQRIEAFRGFTIVTTNMKHAIDPAFLRRFRFAIDFQMPSETERLRLWQRAFPARAPVEPVNWAALAALPLSGGSIRNIALGSAFLAADRGIRIDRSLITAELGEELRKNNQPVPAIDWERGA